MTLKSLSISWLLHSIKILLGDESIRRYIILNDFPKLKHQLKKDILKDIRNRHNLTVQGLLAYLGNNLFRV